MRKRTGIRWVVVQRLAKQRARLSGCIVRRFQPGLGLQLITQSQINFRLGEARVRRDRFLKKTFGQLQRTLARSVFLLQPLQVFLVGENVFRANAA